MTMHVYDKHDLMLLPGLAPDEGTAQRLTVGIWFERCFVRQEDETYTPAALMKRKLCLTPAFTCDDDMEELNVAALSHRKESAAPLTGDREGNIFRHVLSYPLALVLRLRVLQIVCGISTTVMGSVAFIEERQKFNMGLGIPAGSFSIIAAAVSIHTSRGWGVTSGAGAGAAAALLWTAAGCLLVTLIVQCSRTIVDPPGFNHGDGPEEDSRPSSRDLVVIACVQIVLAAATLLSAVVCARIDFSA